MSYLYQVWKVNRLHNYLSFICPRLKDYFRQVYSDLEERFLPIQQRDRYYISFLNESIGLIYIEPLKYKNNGRSTFKNYISLREKQSGYSLKIFCKDKGEEYKGKFQEYLKDKKITHQVTAL